MNWTPLKFILEQMYWFPGAELEGLSFYRGRDQCFLFPKAMPGIPTYRDTCKREGWRLNVQNYLLFILYFSRFISRMWILAQISVQLMWLIWQWLGLCNADVGLDYSFYCCLMEKFICAMTRVWDAGRSSLLSSTEMYVQINVDLALILLLCNFNMCLKKIFFFN